jgi:bacterioferritin-associated ferredoxin
VPYMFVCLCKPLTEADVTLAVRDCLAAGRCSLEEVLATLGLQGEEACGFCVEHPEAVESILADESESHSAVQPADARLIS